MNKEVKFMGKVYKDITTEQAIYFLDDSKEYLNIVNNYESNLNDIINKVIELLERNEKELQVYRDIIVALKKVWGDLV